MVNSIKDIDLTFVKNYLRIEQDFIDDDMELQMYMTVSKSYLQQRCNITKEQLEIEPTLVIPYLMLISEFYGNKSTTVLANTKVNFILDRFINLNVRF